MKSIENALKSIMKNTMKAIAILLFLTSATLNVCLFTGCRTLHEVVYGNPCKYAPSSVPSINDGGKAELVRIAGLLDIKTSGKTASDLSSDIRYKLDRSIDVPITFDTMAFEKMAKDLNSKEEKAMREYHRFISELQDKRVIVIEPEK